MNYLVFFILAFLEFLFMLVLTKELDHIKEYVSINYSSFQFSNHLDKPIGLNILIRILVPVIYIILVSGILYEIEKSWLVEKIYLITVFYYIIKWINIIFVLRRKDLYNWKAEIVLSVVSISICLIIYYTFITKTNQIFVSIDELRDGIWVSIIIFIFVVIKDRIYNNMKTNNREEKKRKDKYIKNKYLYFKDKYDDIITTKNDQLKNITYSILLYENYNRPFAYRILEYIKFFFTRKATLGIMQVETRRVITDRTSVKKGYKIIKNQYLKTKEEYIKNNKNLDAYFIKDVVQKYNKGKEYCNEVIYIMTTIESINDKL